MSSKAPDKIRLIPDEWHIHFVGQLAGGRLFWVDTQLDFSDQTKPTQDFACTFIFDGDGQLIDHKIEFIGDRGTYPVGDVSDAIQRHLTALGNFKISDIWIRTFQVDSHGTTFGLLLRPPGYIVDEDAANSVEAEWRAEFMPGNTLSFGTPWDACEYDM